MAKARPKALVRERPIAALKKAHPSCVSSIETFKVRSKQIIRVTGYEREYQPGRINHGVRAEWSYSDNGSLRRVS